MPLTQRETDGERVHPVVVGSASRRSVEPEGTGARERALKVVVGLVGLIFVFGLYPLMMYLWPSGWRWQPAQPEYEQMIQGVYATLGIFLLIASRRPAEHRSLIAFTAWSSLVHAGIMTVQALRSTHEHGHLLCDVPALIIVGSALLLLMPPKPLRR